MRASYNWLRELLGPAFQVPASDLAERLTRAGLEVESQHAYGAACAHVHVARVVSKEAHPARPKLGLVTVELGGGRTQKVVCGAPNVPEPGGLVVLAPLGTHLPAKGLTLEPKDIGGVTSEGMLCSEAELGLRISGGEGGILILPPGTAEPGTTLASAIPASCDVVFEIGLTPNRPDGLGHMGLAREIAALYGLPFSPAPLEPTRVKAGLGPSPAVKIRIEDTERCPLYGAALVEGVTVGPSPLAVQYRLEALGVRAISNVVDITNLVMMKFGHPIHGFDLARIRGGAIVVRRAAEGEVMHTLDGQKRALVADDLVIADAEGAVALAGVMGGQGSEIQDDTKTVLVECAYFTTRGVRRTSRRHGLHTESSHRFERGVDPGDTGAVLKETAALLCDLAGGTAGDTYVVEGPGPDERATIPLRRDKMNQLLGFAISMDEAKAILERLGCKETSGKSADSAASLAFAPPSHRPDLAIEVDLVEEVLRVHGIDNVPAVLPPMRAGLGRGFDAEKRVIVAAIELGLSQSLTFGFTSASALAAIHAPPATYVLENPLGEERAAMRTSLFPGLFESLRRARRQSVSDVRLFVTGAKFLPGGPGEKLATEAPTFAAVIAGKRDTVLAKADSVDIYDAKGVALELVARALGREATAEPQPADSRSPLLHPRGAANVICEGRVVGQFGILHPEVEESLDLGGSCLLIELDLAALAALGPKTPRYRPIPSLPAATRDVAVVVHDDVPCGDVERAIAEAGGPLVENVAVFDLFRGGSVPADHRSLAFHVVYRDPLASTDPDKARTLTDAEVDQRHAAVEKALAERFGARLRA
ncbi:MAG: phenylalanine--tRNA ligase subunit beta [Myxococcales bacterium]|nr:phenylalanine--tRNA ligase subunit beta [Myxococcales bacterium]